MNMVQKITEQIKEIVGDAINKCIEKGILAIEEVPDILVEVPREKTHGDFATNIAMVLTKQAKKNPRAIAQDIVENSDYGGTYVESIEIAGPGFINFRLNNMWLYKTVEIIHNEKQEYGRVDIGEGKKVMVEFVSANPTGPMHMGNARGAALGDTLAAVLDAAGYDVTREFYINDAGNQIEKFGKSLEARYLQLLGQDAELPEGGYQGQDVVEHMQDLISREGDKYLNADSEERQKIFTEYALRKNLEKIKKDLGDFGVNFDIWFSEQSLYDSNEIMDTVELLKDRGYTYELDGAIWFKASLFGVDKDEVLVRSNGIPTYFAGDIAYHRNKFITREYDWVINIWGADHHGHVPRMKGAMEAIGVDPDRLDIIIMQLVRLLRNGEVARMSKRKGQTITLADLIEEVGRDAARFFFNLRSADTHLDFDLDLAVEKSNENPVFYVQYAHARICSILSQIAQEGIAIPAIDSINLTLLKEETEIDLMKKLAELPEEITKAAQTIEPTRITRYVLEVASLFHTFYNSCRVMVDDESLMRARIALIEATRIVIRNVLDLLSVSAPERM
ncbi:MAG: Arginyl-tRNA synthetase [Firmicutes bacterium]|nr:Arginyl-tRNA synthetase [Bacillota bacterium]MDI6705150.1 arginine--tRNA ligase [Bacillota bacterium]